MGIKEGMYCMEHWVWCINNEYWNTEKNKTRIKNLKIFKNFTEEKQLREFIPIRPSL